MNQVNMSKSDLSKISVNNNRPIDTRNMTNKSDIKLDMLTVESTLKRNKNYVNNEKTVEVRKNFIKKGPGKKETYIGEISSKERFAYVGTLMGRELVRSGIGYYIYPNQDLYFGHWLNNRKNNFGVYSYYTPVDEIEYYIGEWKDGVKNGFGIYFWKKQNTEIIHKDMYDVFIGNFNNGGIHRGLYLKRKLEDEITCTHYYFGKFNQDAKRSDENSFYYTTDNETLIYGHIEDNTFIKGNIVQQKDDRIFSFEKSEKTLNLGDLDYIPEQITEEEVLKELKDIYQNFKDFEKEVNFKFFSNLVVTIYKLIDKHSSLETFTTENLSIENDLKIEFFRGMYQRFEDLIEKLVTKEQERSLKKRDSLNNRPSIDATNNPLFKRNSGITNKGSEPSQTHGDLNNLTPRKTNSFINKGHVKTDEKSEDKPLERPKKKDTIKDFKLTHPVIAEKNENETQSKKQAEKVVDWKDSLKKSDSFTASKLIHKKSVKDMSKKMVDSKSEKTLIKKDSEENGGKSETKQNYATDKNLKTTSSGNLNPSVSAFTLTDNQK
jgi:hypothetical protein